MALLGAALGNIKFDNVALSGPQARER